MRMESLDCRNAVGEKHPGLWVVAPGFRKEVKSDTPLAASNLVRKVG
jgi:hypothetical protein